MGPSCKNQQRWKIGWKFAFLPLLFSISIHPFFFCTSFPFSLYLSFLSSPFLRFFFLFFLGFLFLLFPISLLILGLIFLFCIFPSVRLLFSSLSNLIFFLYSLLPLCLSFIIFSFLNAKFLCTFCPSFPTPCTFLPLHPSFSNYIFLDYLLFSPLSLVSFIDSSFTYFLNLLHHMLSIHSSFSSFYPSTLPPATSVPSIPPSYFPPSHFFPFLLITSHPLPPTFPSFTLSLSSSFRSVCCTVLWRRLSWFSGQPGQRVRPGPVTCGSPLDRLSPVWAWRGCPRPYSPSGRRAGGTSHEGTSRAKALQVSRVHWLWDSNRASTGASYLRPEDIICGNIFHSALMGLPVHFDINTKQRWTNTHHICFSKQKVSPLIKQLKKTVVTVATSGNN